jgi:hypothetical protein
LENYIVRIYRRKAGDPVSLVGSVENVQKGVKDSFKTLDDLMGFLANWKEKSNGGRSQERRRAARLELKLPVVVKKISAHGVGIQEETELKDLSPSGAYLFLKQPVNTDSRLNLLIDPDRSGMIRKALVVRVDRLEGKTGVGVRFEGATKT